VGDRPQDGAGLTIRAGAATDAPFVVGLGATAFARFGDYGPIMREFLGSPDVTAFIAETAGESVGFALVDQPAGFRRVVDLVAIAVEHTHRRTGIGRALLRRVIAFLEERDEPTLLVLTVAEDNLDAIALFRLMGFQMIPGSDGLYAGGQTSRRMGRSVMPRLGDAR
jgi:ribosomal protein S18 acetylase RimI-like enzyme